MWFSGWLGGMTAIGVVWVGEPAGTGGVCCTSGMSGEEGLRVSGAACAGVLGSVLEGSLGLEPGLVL